ncbi:hypothetical protein BDV36DRAFT_291112 [Aspergillus pseudocaelatus]|uniref:Xylanolytic transcriptional activator regulatory domain-containing protein n=1 Tax=Aspergillus pseudocaelatus TaxID=1825620 RepID=A0ABQ6X3A6_9EURO|nr:hypothetical protein BDV36DRAFT_291112 [Aspergillus pseudocaelatus]
MIDSCVYLESSTYDGFQCRRTSLLQSIAHDGTLNNTADGQGENGKHPACIPDPTNRTIIPTDQSRTFLSSKGEKVYTGDRSSLSYLDFVRKVIKRYAGASSFTEAEFKDSMFEIDPSPASSEILPEPDEEQQKGFIETYFEASSAILDLVSREEVYAYLGLSSVRLDETHRRNISELAIAHLVLAIGSQCRGVSPSDLTYASRYFAQGQQVAFNGLLYDPSMNMVRHFLLMAFYLLGACHRNAACMYLGVAWKAANTLGLHNMDHYQLLATRERNFRLRTWKSLCVMNTIVNSILGRLEHSYRPWPDDRRNDNTDLPPQFGSLTVNPTYELCQLIDGFERILRKERRNTLTLTEKYLHDLRGWSQSLPIELRQMPSIPITNSNLENREQLLGAIQVTCLYYFAVLLATRPFLTSNIMLKLGDRESSLAENRVPELDETRTSAHLAQVCVASATYMVKMSQAAMETGCLLRNMCHLKAWLFASGLLLGFAFFAEEGIPTETDEAFHAARSVLLYLSGLSPQAKRYYEILTSLSEVINHQRKQRVEERRRITSQFVEQILHFDARLPGIDQSYLSHRSGSNGPIPGLNHDTADLDTTFSFVSGLNVDNAANLPLHWDELAIDWQTFGMSKDST